MSRIMISSSPAEAEAATGAPARAGSEPGSGAGTRRAERPDRPALLDAGVLKGLRNLERRLGKSLLPEMFEVLERHVPSSLAGLRRALAEGDAASLRRISHKLKSSARSLGLPRLSESCGDLERRAAEGCLASGEDRLAAIEEDYERAAGALERYLADGA